MRGTESVHPGPRPKAPREERLGVAVIDQTPLFREGLSVRVLREPGMRLVGATGQPNVAVLLRERLAVDVLVVDAMLDPDGQLARLLTHAGFTVVSLVREPYRTTEFLATMLGAGVHGLVLHASPPERILEAIRRSRTEGRYVDPALLPLVRPDQRGPIRATTRTAERPLSNREYQVLRLIADGLSNQGIAEALVLSVETVRTHIKSLLRKMSARDRAHAVAKAFRAGLLSAHEDAGAAGAVASAGTTAARLRAADGVTGRIPRARHLRSTDRAS